MAKGPLANVRVLEYGHLVAAPYCAKLMADLGADVIKIEEPGVGDPARRQGSFFKDIPHPEKSALFLYLNTNKRSVTLNLHTRTGQEILQQLIQHADILIEDASPASAKDLGLTYESLARLNSKLIMTSITPFGCTGPYKDYKAYELNVYHAGGDGFLLPAGLTAELFPEREPIKAGGYLGMYEGGLIAAVATLGALCGRVVLGKGQHIDVSLQEAQLALNRATIRAFVWGQGLEKRRERAFTYGGIMPCADGYIELLALEEHQWNALLELVGNPEWAKEERFRDRVQRAYNGEEVNNYLREWAKDKSAKWIMKEGQARRIPVGFVHTTKDIVESEQMRVRDFLMEVDHPEAERFLYPTAAHHFSKMPWKLRRPAPRLGEHNEEILCGILSYSREDIVKMFQANII
jgi:crotonobetainyl-CoA:carnitine CoA-transferase CaiB-like acyl-CoA transferase